MTTPSVTRTRWLSRLVATAVLALVPTTAGAQAPPSEPPEAAAPTPPLPGAAISLDETSASLSERLAALSAALLIDKLPALLAGALVPVAQPDVGVTWAPPLQKHEGMLDLAAPARQLRDLLRAMTPWPGGQLQVGAEVWKVFAEGAAVVEAEGAPGTLLAIDGEQCVLATGAGGLLFSEMQRPGRRRMGAGSALRGARIAVGSRLGLTPAAPSSGGVE